MDVQSSQPSAEENEVFQLPRQKKLHEDAYLGQFKQVRKMRGKSLSANDAEIEVGTVVQFALHPQ